MFPQLVTQDTVRPAQISLRNHWRPLHRYAWRHLNNWDVDKAKKDYARWVASMPSSNCKCRQHWFNQTRSKPFDFSTPHTFADSAWTHHNLVRERLGQPVVSREAAYAAATRPVVGFIATSYMPIGGTETFHQTLLPLLSKDDRLWIDGFVVSGEWDQGDLTKLGVPGAKGVKAAQLLAARCDVLVTWGLSDLSEILPTPRPVVIATHHSDPTSGWSNETIAGNKGLIDRAITVHPDVSADLLGVPVTHIPNAVNPARYSGDATGLRDKWGIAPTDTIHFWCHRLSAEKQPELATQVADALPEGHVMVMAGEGAVKVHDSSKLRYVGRIDSPGDWLSVASTFLSLSTFDGFGLSVAEAMGAGVPVVSTPVGIAAQPGMAITVAHDAPVSQWVSALTGAVGTRNSYAQEFVRNEYSIDPWVNRWANAILSAVTDY